MASFIYFYSKFTEEFLLLTSAGIFALLSIYCYHWVVRTRRLGAARNQLPAGVVRVYLNQLINEAQDVRAQLFGLIPQTNGESIARPMQYSTAAPVSVSTYIPPSSGSGSGDAPTIPSELLEKLKALEKQLVEKEGLVVNINVEKTRLLEEIENLKQNQAAAGGAAGAQDDLLTKIKNLEERLEEYSMFEDDLANLKRLQQENTSLKKRLEEMSGALDPAKVEAAPAGAAANPPTPTPTPTPTPAPAPEKAAPNKLDNKAVEKLLDGASATPPQTPAPVAPVQAAPAPAPVPVAVAPPPAAAAPVAAQAEPELAKKEEKKDEFEKLVDSVESSLEKPAAVAAPAPVATPAPAVAAAPAPTPAPAAPAENIASKTDEELLKEFENLLNS